MSPDGPIDLGTLDASIGRAHARVEKELSSLVTEDGRRDARAGSPFEGAREVASQATFKELRELEPGPIHADHRDGLLRWVHELLQLRVSWDLIVAEADASHAPDPALSPRAAADLVGKITKTFDETRRALIEAPQPAATEIALRRLDELASPVAAVRKELRLRRFEAARRLGLAHPWALASSGTAAEIADLARTVLDATEPLAIELHKELGRRSGAAVSVSLAIHDGFARDAREGWPAHLGQRWLEDVFRAVAPRPPRTVRMPTALGGASFLRAASAWGLALRLGGTARALPFALARDPYPIEGHALGTALAATIAHPVFAKRKLGLPLRAVDAHARALGRVLFITLRRTAADLINGMNETFVADRAEELGARIFGAPLPAALAAAWSDGGLSGVARVDAPARFIGAVRAHALLKSLVDRFDVDWFDNPRLATHLASIACGPVWQGELPSADAARAIARMFEETLG